MTICLVKTNCISSQKMLDFFSKNGTVIKKENISFRPVQEKWLFDINSFNNKKSGIFDVVNPNHHYIKENKLNIKTMPRKLLLDTIISHPELLSMPICLQYSTDNILKRVFIGFSEPEYENNSLKTVGHSTYFANISKSFVYDDCCVECQIRELRQATDENK